MNRRNKKSHLVFVVISLAVCVIQNSHAMGMGGGGGSSPTIIDPPKGAAFKDPVTMKNLSKKTGMVKINLEAKVAPIIISGVTANLKTYNGHYPAPTINVKKGDVLKVHFKNILSRC
ncbi:MAG: multicopper oxidase domain-containing protein [Methylococcaceae bacterium]